MPEKACTPPPSSQVRPFYASLGDAPGCNGRERQHRLCQVEIAASAKLGRKFPPLRDLLAGRLHSLHDPASWDLHVVQYRCRKQPECCAFESGGEAAANRRAEWQRHWKVGLTNRPNSRSRTASCIATVPKRNTSA